MSLVLPWTRLVHQVAIKGGRSVHHNSIAKSNLIFASLTTPAPKRTTSLLAVVLPSYSRSSPILSSLRSFSSSTRRSEPTSSSSSSSTSSTPATPLPSSSFLRRTRRDYARQLSRVQHELSLLRKRLPPLRPTRRSFAFTLLVLSLLFLALYHFSSPFRTFVIAIDRCSRVGYAVVRCIIDYKILFRKTWDESTPEGKLERHEDYEKCHEKCAIRIREVLKKNGGIYIKLGQHLSSVQLIPVPWSKAMIPLQDQCKATPLNELQELFLTDVGAPMSTFFSSFDPNPIGVASLAQVHRATMRDTGEQVAVKVMHPDLEEFCYVDMKTTTLMLKLTKAIFPSFEFTWLGEEMEENLPLEMDFRHEAANAQRCRADFAALKKTTLVIPKVIWAKKRAMVMQFIEGARIDDLAYLSKHHIDRNEVAKQLSHIFSRMIYITGFFHADPHGGNLLIRPAQEHSRSPFNFEIVLLDHGLYFEMESSLRVNYARLWLSLIAPSTPKIELERRKYAYAAGNIDDELYPIFQAAITGRAALDDPYAKEGQQDFKASVMEFGEFNDEEQKRRRHTIAETEGLMTSIFDLLRRVPRRILMVLKVNDLARALDNSLHTTHGPARIFMIVAHYCNLAAYQDDLSQLRLSYNSSGLSLSLLGRSIRVWSRYQFWNWSLGTAMWWTDIKSRFKEVGLWVRGVDVVEEAGKMKAKEGQMGKGALI